MTLDEVVERLLEIKDRVGGQATVYYGNYPIRGVICEPYHLQSVLIKSQ